MSMLNIKADPDLRSTVKNLYDELLLAWNSSNASDFAGLFSMNGNMIGFDGSRANGSAEISSQLTAVFEDHRTGSFVAIVKDIRQISETIFVLNAVAGMIPAGEKDINPELNCIQTLIANSTDDQILIEVFQTTPAALHGRKDLKEQMTSELRQTLRESKTSNGS